MLNKMRSQNFSTLIILCAVHFLSYNIYAQSIDINATVKALRLSNTITGGLMPSSDPLFAQMVTKVQARDIQGAAMIAASSSYATNYLMRRLAFQMQTPSLEASVITDSDATAFLIAHFSGAAGSKPSLSSIWSENATYLVNVASGTAIIPTHASSLTAKQITNMDWSSSLVRVSGQNAKALSKNAAGERISSPIAIPEKHVGGYITLSDKVNDNSFAMYGATAGTNLRMIEGLWEIATGLTLVDVQSSLASPQDVPRFLPIYNPNFFKGQGQASCISCHGGGYSSLNHGYSTVADLFDYDQRFGFVYIEQPTTATMKSLGSNEGRRNSTLQCDLVKNPTAVCNPDSLGASATQAWDLIATWSSSGVLNRMGWKGPTSGEGLNSLGQALGRAQIIYSYFTKRVVREICPLGIFSEADITKIANAANPYAITPGTDDVRTIISMVAANTTCQ